VGPDNAKCVLLPVKSGQPTLSEIYLHNLFREIMMAVYGFKRRFKFSKDDFFISLKIVFSFIYKQLSKKKYLTK